MNRGQSKEITMIWLTMTCAYRLLTLSCDEPPLHIPIPPMSLNRRKVTVTNGEESPPKGQDESAVSR
ncbi:unnamed protein product [Arctogadus glacialis]